MYLIYEYPREASKHFFWNFGCLWLQFKTFKTHKEVFLITDSKFPWHNLSITLTSSLIGKEFQRKFNKKKNIVNLAVWKAHCQVYWILIFKLVIQGVFWKGNAKGSYQSSEPSEQVNLENKMMCTSLGYLSIDMTKFRKFHKQISKKKVCRKT